MKVLVIAEGYPSPDNLYNLAYIHSRLVQYVKEGIEVKVVSFQANSPYIFEGISISDLETFENHDNSANYDIVISHAPNIRNHVRFISKHLKDIQYLIFFIHGHEVLIKSDYYPAPFPFEKSQVFKKKVNLLYDYFKIFFLKIFFSSLLIKKKAHFVFVSEWMKEEFLKNVKVRSSLINPNSSVIHNNIHHSFIEKRYERSEIWGDFVTIRPLDNSKYGIDIVRRIALSLPDFSFHIYGRGKFFKYYSLPKNVVWHDKYLKQNEIPELLNHYRCGLMPTRLDSQGVTMCEFATYGLPLYTSDLAICREMLSEFGNVRFFSNTNETDFKKIVPFEAEASRGKQLKFSTEKTVYKEIELIKTYKIKE